ncbi:MAG: type I restriction endonuclease subunit R [Flavobacteriales bacterium]|nr:type I restriction endonuclease subunit R [Flavobacteriales bacterium]
MGKQGLTPDNEKVFEEHFCNQLDVKGGYRVRFESRIDTNKELCIYFEDLEEFLEATQQEPLRQLKSEYGAHWQKQFEQAFRQELSEKELFQVLQKGIAVGQYHFALVFFKPENETNKHLAELYKKNRYTAVRQWHFGADTQRESLDIVLLVNGFAIATIELKNEGTSGTFQKAIEQYIARNLDLPIFRQPFLHIVSDTSEAKMAAAFSKPPSEKDFRPFNQDIVNETPKNKKEYPVHYLYHDILLPERLLNYLETYLYPSGKGKWMFPRYHQQRATRMVVEDVKEQYAKKKQLDLKYLIQHSTGSGKSSTIVWMVQNLRNAFVGDTPVFDSIVVLTDRINLDDQISKDFQKAIMTEGVAHYAETTSDLKHALEANKKVIVSTIHKFSHLKELADQTHKKICFLIDEAHRSQDGKLHEGATSTFTSDEKGVEKTPEDAQEKLLSKIEKKKFPNLAFIALTATPSDKTLQNFGKPAKDEKGKSIKVPHDVYSMDQAIKEGYIMDVAKHIYSYNTLYELNKEVDTKKEYLPMVVKQGLRQKAYEDSAIIKEKCNRIVTIFENESAHKIAGKAKAMVVASSRLAAVKYKFFMDEELAKRGLKHKTLVAFSGSIPYEDVTHTESSLNAAINPKGLKIEDLFEEDDTIRFLIVANKFQTGFSEPLLHTMFLDKPVRDRTAVQTLSRLNRIHPEKKDTLVVDFSGSYEAIMKAYKKYQNDVVSYKSIDPKQLEEIRKKLLQFGVFTAAELEEIAKLGLENKESNTPAIVGLVHHIKEKFEKNLTQEKRDEFRTLMNRYLGLFNYISGLYHIPKGDLTNTQVFLIYLSNKLAGGDYSSLRKELEDVYVINYALPEVEQREVEDPPTGGGSGSGAARVKQTKTVKEVIAEINQAFKALLGDAGVEVVSKFLEVVSKDEELIEIVRNNRAQDPVRVYEDIMRDKLKVRLVHTIMETAPDKYAKIMNENVEPRVSQTAYQVVRSVALVA